MKKIQLLLIFCPFILFGQTQIGNDIIGNNVNDYFGYSLNLNSEGNILAIGAGKPGSSGYTGIYKNMNEVWTQLGEDINGEFANEESGFSVSLNDDGSIVAIGAVANYGNGHKSGEVRVYKYINGVWTKLGEDINGQAADDQSGFSISLNSEGNILAIGAPYNDENGIDSGHVRVYKNIDGVWTQLGEDIVGEEGEDHLGVSGDHSGWSLNLNSEGNIVAIGAPYNNGDGRSSGHVRVYKNISGVWTQLGEDINGKVNESGLGRTLNMNYNGNIIAIGLIGDYATTTGSGIIRIYENINEVWTQLGEDIIGEADYDYSGSTGTSLSLNSEGNILAIGAHYNDGNGNNSGHVRIFKNINNTWQLKTEIDGKAPSDYLGFSVSLNSKGNILAVSGPLDDRFTNNPGYARVYDLSAILSSDSFIESKFTIFPIPTKDLVTIELKDNLQVEKIAIYNHLGQFIKSSNQLNINTSDLSKGIYFLQVVTAEGKASKKLIIE